MSQIAPHPVYLQIEDALDAVGQKYRGQRIVRGAMLWIVIAGGITWLATLAAHFVGSATAGQSRWTIVLLAIWLASVLTTAVVWLIRPLLIRPRAVEVARLLETRVDGLHNGLTNGVLLAGASDLNQSPWLVPIFEEIVQTIQNRPIDRAVRWSDLRPLGIRLSVIALPMLIILGLFPQPFAHGWQQLMHPSAFVPQQAAMQILSVLPGDVTLVSGQALEITVTASGPQSPNAKLVFDGATPAVELPPTITDNGVLRYSYRQEHVDAELRYRVDVGGTQSTWYAVKIVRQIKLKELRLSITPPAYTRQAKSDLVLKADQVDAAPITVPQGSSIELSADTDVTANAAMLQAGDGSPMPMNVAMHGQRFSASIAIVEDTPLAILLTDGSGQIIARLPDQSLLIHCTKDAPPTIEMKWPTNDAAVPPAAELKIAAMIKDDFGLSSVRVLMSSAANAPLEPVQTVPLPAGTTSYELSYAMLLPAEIRKHGNSIRVQVEATDNRDLPALALVQQSTLAAIAANATTQTTNTKDTGASQITLSSVFEIKFRDALAIAAEQKEQTDKLREKLNEMLRIQLALHTPTLSWKPGQRDAMAKVNGGQVELRQTMQTVAGTFEFTDSTRIVQKTLQVLALNPAKDAVDLSNSLLTETQLKEQVRQWSDLQSRQRRIISTLESLLAILNTNPEPTTQATTRATDPLVNKAEEFKKLDEALKQFMAEQQKLLDQAASLAKKPVDNFDDKDKKLLNDLLQSQDKLDAFMLSKVNDLSKLAEQDMSNAALLKDMIAVYSEVTMAKDGLKAKAMEIAVPAEEAGLELAKEMTTNIEKWLSDTPDRQKWTQEELATKQDVPMAELPKELEDMVGELMEQEEDLFDEMEDQSANMTDSIDKGAGWDAADGPIANMSAKGVTGNVNPNNNDMGGRSGEGRQGRSQGEFVGDNAVGKGGRNTPTRLDPTPFQQGEIKDTSKDPVGGATGGGKISGQGAAGLEGPVPPKMKQEMQRLATKQAEIRNNAERLNLQYQLGHYDNFKLQESVAMMRRVESDLNANRYQSALRRRDVLLDSMDSSHLLLAGQIHVQHDTTPVTSQKMQQSLNDAAKGDYPAGWNDALKEYYKKLASE